MLLVSNLAGKANNVNFAPVKYWNNLLSVRGALLEAIIKISHYPGCFKQNNRKSYHLNIRLKQVKNKIEYNGRSYR